MQIRSAAGKSSTAGRRVAGADGSEQLHGGARGAEDGENLEGAAGADGAVEGCGDGVGCGHEGLEWAPVAL
jgi:hypothetical protein